MPPRRNIRDEDWERLRLTIRKLYLEEDRSFKDVLLILGTFHSFYPSKAQLEWRLKQWHFAKNMGVMDWKYVGNEIYRRKCIGKESKVYLSGIPLRTKAIQKGVSRYCYETAIEKAMHSVPKLPMPDDQPLLVCTPMPEEMDWPCRLDNIPWLLSRRIVEGLALKLPSHMSISYSSSGFSSERLLESILFRGFTLQSYTTRLMQTFKALCSIMPEEYEGAHVIRAQGLLQTSGSNTISAELLACLVYFLSNNIFPYRCDGEHRELHEFNMRLLLQFLRESRPNVLARDQYATLPPTLQSSLDGLFREAIEASDLGVVKLLLQAGVDVNTSFSNSTWWRGTALQHAAELNQPELLQIFIAHGADTETIDIETLTRAWSRRKIAKGSPAETMRILLSIYRFRSEDERHASRLLFWMSYTARTPVTEAVIGFFRSSFIESSSAAKAQLLITAIRTNSRFVDELVAELGNYVNSCGYHPETPMTAAAYKGDIQLCGHLLYLGATLEPSHKAPTPLQWAASFADVIIVQQLLNWGADVNFCHPYPTLLRVAFEDLTSMRLSYVPPLLSWYEASNRELVGSLGRTALQSALLGGNAATAKCLLDAGATLVGGELVMAIWGRQFELVDSLLARGASFEDECTIFGTDTAIEAAILSGNADLVHRVIAADRRSVTGKALCASVLLAKATGDLAIFKHLKHLLTYKSQLSVSQDLWVGTAMCLAADLNCMENPEIMLSSGLHPETSWYFDLCNREMHDGLARLDRSISDTSIIRIYLNWRRTVCICFEDRRLSLSRPMIEVAICLNHWNFLKLLLGYGYQPGPTNPLHIGYSFRLSIEILRLLHDIGIPMTETVLAHAICMEAGCETIQWLLSVGVNINERSEDVQSLRRNYPGYRPSVTSLQAAVWKGDIDLVQQLIDRGADVNEPPYPRDGGMTSLQLAALHGFFGIVRRLLELGADPNASGQYRTAIENAAENGHLDIVQLLLNSGVETSGCSRRHFVKSVAYADRKGHHAVVRLLKSSAGWTEADEHLLGQEDLIPIDHWEKTKMPAYTRRYYSDEWSERTVTVEEDPPLDEVESNTEGCRPSDGIKPDSEAHASNTEEASQALIGENLSSNVDIPVTWLASEDRYKTAQELAEELDGPSEALLSTLGPISNLPNAYESLSKEFGLEFLPSSMSDQIREELEGGGRVEELGDDLWTEEYSRFLTELL